MTEQERQLQALLELHPTVEFQIIGTCRMTHLVIRKSNILVKQGAEGTAEQALKVVINFLENLK